MVLEGVHTRKVAFWGASLGPWRVLAAQLQGDGGSSSELFKQPQGAPLLLVKHPPFKDVKGAED